MINNEEYAVSFAIIDYAAGARKQVPPPFGKEKIIHFKNKSIMKKNSEATRAEAKNSAKKQTAKAHAAMMRKLTRDKYDMRYNHEGVGWDMYLDSSDIKQMTVMAAKAEAGHVISTDFDVELDTEFGSVNAKVLYGAKRQGMNAYFTAAVKVGENNVWKSDWICCAKINGSKNSIDYDAMKVLNDCVERAVSENVVYAEREVTLRMRRNEDGGWDLIVPQGLNIKEVRYE